MMMMVNVDDIYFFSRLNVTFASLLQMLILKQYNKANYLLFIIDNFKFRAFLPFHRENAAPWTCSPRQTSSKTGRPKSRKSEGWKIDHLNTNPRTDTGFKNTYIHIHVERADHITCRHSWLLHATLGFCRQKIWQCGESYYGFFL